MSLPGLREIQKLLEEKGMVLFGIASPTQAIPGIKTDLTPLSIQNDSKSVICFGLPIPKGIIHANNHHTLLYWRYCSMTYRRIDEVTNMLCVFLEEKGFIASPVYSCYPWKIYNREFWGLVPLVYWAELAGLGKITKSGLLGNPKYGTRILLGGVITSKGFKPSERKIQEICPKDCFECIDACPTHAIGKSGKVDHNLCLRYANSNPLMTHVLKGKVLQKESNFENIMNTIGVEDHSQYNCLECLRLCPLNAAN